jgi:hypothetical protein
VEVNTSCSYHNIDRMEDCFQRSTKGFGFSVLLQNYDQLCYVLQSASLLSGLKVKCIKKFQWVSGLHDLLHWKLDYDGSSHKID